MGGENPYIQKTQTRLPTTPYTITFKQGDKETPVKVDPSELPGNADGLRGSILGIGLEAGLKIDHACGGVCACSTCHVIVEQGLETCNEASEDEEDMLDMAAGVTANSRLACQTVPDGTKDLVVEIPEWNRNLASEDH